MPYLFRVAVQAGVINAEECSAKFHWAIAGVTGAESNHHIDGGGYATVVEVLSGSKIWAVGSKVDDGSFANDSHVVRRGSRVEEWLTLSWKTSKWEVM